MNLLNRLNPNQKEKPAGFLKNQRENAQKGTGSKKRDGELRTWGKVGRKNGQRGVAERTARRGESPKNKKLSLYQPEQIPTPKIKKNRDRGCIPETPNHRLVRGGETIQPSRCCEKGRSENQKKGGGGREYIKVPKRSHL